MALSLPTRRPLRSTSSGSAPTSPSSRNRRYAASRSSTSTTPPPARSPGRSSTAIARFYTARTPTSTAGVHYLSERATAAYDGGPREGGAVPRRRLSARRSSSPAAPPRRSTSWRRAGAGAPSGRATKSWSPGWSTTPTSCPGSWWPSRPAPRSARCRSPTAGELDLDAFDRLLTDRTRLFAVGHVSNALGTINPVRELAARARARGALVLVDGAQSAPHLPVDVAGARLRLLRLLGPQAVRSHRHRRALRPGRAARARCRPGRAAAT